MERNQGRRMTAEEKLRVVVEGRQSGATVIEVYLAIALLTKDRHKRTLQPLFIP